MQNAELKNGGKKMIYRRNEKGRYVGGTDNGDMIGSEEAR